MCQVVGKFIEAFAGEDVFSLGNWFEVWAAGHENILAFSSFVRRTGSGCCGAAKFGGAKNSGFPSAGRPGSEQPLTKLSARFGIRR